MALLKIHLEVSDTMPIKSTREMFVHELADLYDAEHQFLEAQHMMHANATDPKLKTMLREHIAESEQQVKNLERVFGFLGKQPKRQHCDGAEGIVSEGKKAIAEAGSPEMRDSIIAGGATKAEHYEMVSYADLIEVATLLKLRQAVPLLEKNREQEVRTARRLERTSPRLLRQIAA
jgi:ferritin-like metal-binding protein YciE